MLLRELEYSYSSTSGAGVNVEVDYLAQDYPRKDRSLLVHPWTLRNAGSARVSVLGVKSLVVVERGWDLTFEIKLRVRKGRVILLWRR